jgi:DNA mismatch repair protein MutS2
MNPKTFRALEYPKILLHLAGCTSTSLGREKALRLRPSIKEEVVRLRQRETSEARALLEEDLDPGLSGTSDLRSLLKRALIASSLSPTELLEIRATLLCGKNVRRRLASLRNRAPTLAGMAERIDECSALMDEIGRAIDEKGEVKDEASPNLARIRQELRQAHEKLLAKLERLVSDPTVQTFLQEPIITQRSGRYVIPLKADSKGRIPGVVHDESASGATLFIEPLATLELNNLWRELQLEEEREVNRILRELTALVGEQELGISSTLRALTSLDLAFAQGRYSIAIRGTEPRFVPFRPRDSKHPGSAIRLIQARHPLLSDDKVVPIDVYNSEDFFILVITGPNTGGKTVTLKTVGLLAMMAQAGLHLPCADASLSIFQGIYADIGDEQSIEQSLSTFSSHLTNIVDILASADDRSLVLLDELGAGTDPVEGSALARAILDHLLHRTITSLVATHYSALKSYAQVTPGVENACVDFDLETLAPTYKLSIGLPGASNALAIARRLGLREEIVEAARRLLSTTEREVEIYLAEIRAARQEALKARELALKAQEEAETKTSGLERRLLALEEERSNILNQARAEARSELLEARETMRQILAQVKKGAPRAQVRADLGRLETRLQPFSPPRAKKGAVELGARVWVSELAKEGTVVRLEEGEAEVQVGSLRARVRVEDLEPRPSKAEEVQPQPIRVPLVEALPGELDLRGMRAEEAVNALEKYLDKAVLAGLVSVRIIHGKGTGALRRLTKESVAKHPLVASHRSGEEGEGGDGVTMVELAV